MREPESRRKWTQYCALGTLTDRYDNAFLVLLGAQYFSQGSKTLVGLGASSLFKDYYNLDPGYMQVLSSFIGLPWSLKLLYGLISDNCPLYGSRRRNYLILMSLVQVSASLLLFITSEGANEKFTTFLLIMMSLSVASMDVIVDSLMVI